MLDKKVIVLVSGGMDSVTALWQAHADPQLNVVAGLSFDYGSKHNAKEIPMAARNCARHDIPHHITTLNFGMFESALLKGGDSIPDGHYEEESMKQTVVPFRNGIMLAYAAGVAESLKVDGVVIAAHIGDHAIYPDCRSEFLVAMGAAIAAGTYAQVEILSPYGSMSKAEIVSQGVALGVQYEDTWSCYKGSDLHCGTCGTCVERIEAFYLAGVTDPTEYANAE